MLNYGARTILFLSSYAPLGALLALLYWGRQDGVVVVSLCGVFLGIVGSVWILMAGADAEPWSVKVVDYRLRGDEVMGYIAAYLIPLVSLDLTDGRQRVAAIIIVALFWYLYVTTDMLHINPTLHILGFRVYDVTLEGSGNFRLIARAGLHRADLLHVVKMDAGLLIDRKRR